MITMTDTCKRGHPRTGENTYVSPKGKYGCKLCLRITKNRTQADIQADEEARLQRNQLIVTRYAAGDLSRDIAADLGLSISTVTGVVRRAGLQKPKSERSCRTCGGPRASGEGLDCGECVEQMMTIWREGGHMTIKSECLTATPKHAACNGDAWDFEADEPTKCMCECHEEEQ